MTEPTRFLNLSWVAPLLAGLISLGLWRWGLAHWLLLGTLLGHFTLLLVGVLLDTTPCSVLSGIRRVFCWIIMLWILGWLLTLLPGQGGATGSWLRTLPASLGKWAWHGSRIMFRFAVHSLCRALWPSPRKAGPLAKERPE